MDNSALLNEFLVESFENLSSINSDLTQLEKNPEDSELVNKLYRTVHTMKGSASFLGFQILQEITHTAENLLDEIREGNQKITPNITDTLLNTFDLCHSILKTIESSGNDEGIDITDNVKKLEAHLDPVNAATDEKTESSSREESVSAAAMESLKELVGEGKVDANVLSELKGAPQETTSPSTVEHPETGVSDAAMESLKELVGEGKLDVNALIELESSPQEPTPSHAEKVSDAALDSLKELIEEGKLSSNVLEDISAKQEAKPEEVQDEDPAPPVVAAKAEVEKEVVKKEVKKTTKKPAKPADSKQSIADSFVRVNVNVLDKIMNIVGELVLNRNQIVQYSNKKSEQEFNRLAQQLNVITSELQSEVMSTRMQQIGSILTKFERLVRDFSRTSGKQIQLKLSGEGTELDKTLIEAIKDPLVHIIRNACDHGLETIEEREASNKPAEGTVHIKSYNESGQVTIEIVDDGRGLDPEKIGAKAIEKGVINQDQLNQMSDNQIFMLIFAPGFSTAEKITNISGRGVGMDVVKTNIEKIGGTVSIASELGQGTTFKLRIPLTLAIVPALVIESSKQSFAIPQLNLVELVRLETSDEMALIEKIQGSEFLKLRGKLTPVFNLNDNLSLDKVRKKNEAMMKVTGGYAHEVKDISEIAVIDDAVNIVILKAEDVTFGVIVDDILDTEEIVVKPLNSGLKHLSLFGGATIMGDGSVALILDALGFLNTVSKNRNRVAERENELLAQAAETIRNKEDFQENLLFTLHDDREYAIPLSMVSRLEEFSFSQVEMTGDQPIVRYLDAPMPLINLETSLQLNKPSILQAVKKDQEGSLSCIVMAIRSKNYGLIVKEVLDISIDQANIDDTAVDREGIIGTVFINDKTISLIDIYKILELQKLGPVDAVKYEFDRRVKNKKILVVDDSPMYRKLEKDLLTRAGYTVETAKNGDEGYDRIRAGGFDLLLTDIEMPKLTGYELATKIRQELKNNDLPIVALSTRYSDKDQEKGKECGFDHHLEKLKNFEVIDIINEILLGK